MSDHESPADNEPKIHVDDDWKSQVEQEKEELRKQMESESANQPAGEIEMPPASFPILITTMATQALANLGQIPDPIEGKPVIRKSLAKHFIDTLAMLEEKTQGNLDDTEKQMLEETLHQLRLVFVNTPDSMPEKGQQPASPLELPD
ncbi:MAG: DUF1844 domain-containing protein [Pirellulaceae bacterium]